LIVENASNHLIDGRTIVINPSASDVFTGDSPPTCVPAFSSDILMDTIVTQAEVLILLRVDEDAATADVKEEPGWALYSDLDPVFPRDVPLWRSSQDDAGTITFDAAPVLENTAHKEDTFHMKVNLWFAPPGTNCLVHNEHDFIEVHTQVKGTGRMQKFGAQDLATMYEDLPMAPGFTNPAPFCGIGVDSPFVYPWHQYRSDSDCIWLVIEYHLAP